MTHKALSCTNIALSSYSCEQNHSIALTLYRASNPPHCCIYHTLIYVVSLYRIYFSLIVKKALSLETLSNSFLEPTSTEQSV